MSNLQKPQGTPSPVGSYSVRSLYAQARTMKRGKVVCRAMRRYLLVCVVLLSAAWAANIKLYLKEGGYQLVREYKVQDDRVRYYSLERSDWEEIPLDLVDLKRTESEAAQRQSEIEKEAKAISEEETVEREQQKEISRIPQDPGVYWIDGKQTHVIALAETSVVTKKGRSILKRLAPIPIVSGKATLELNGAKSANLFTNPEQEFYLQLSAPQRFGIAKLTPKGNVRIVENLTIMPVTNETIEEPMMVETFRKQLTNDGLLYKIWPKERLEPGEYAVVEYTEGKLNMQVWDFSIQRGK
jgi:hypothetical protein